MHGRLSSLPVYWRPFLKRLTAECKTDGTALSLRTLLFAMRDMPYGRPIDRGDKVRDCITQWRGTCSAKHFAAYELLEALGHSPKLWLACYQLDFSNPYYSDALRIQAKNQKVYDVHNFLTCQLNGTTRIIDITFPVSLGSIGLPVTEQWTGNENFVLCCDCEETRQIKRIEDADDKKQAWLRELNTHEALVLRETAIQELMQIATQA